MKLQIRQNKIVTILRLAMGWIFMWAFVDKLFGFGFATEASAAWIRGGSPTSGFLLYGTHGPLAPLFQLLAGMAIVDWFFMLGLAFVGLSLLTNIQYKLGSIVGMLLMALMYLAAMPPTHNPLIDEHIIYILVLLIIWHTSTQVHRGKK